MIDRTDLHAYVDGELTSTQEAEIRASVDSSPNSAKEIEAIRSLKSMLHDRTQSPEVAQSWKACIKRLDEVDKARRVETYVSRYAPALCGAFFLCIVIGGMINRRHDVGNRPSQNLSRFVPGAVSYDSKWLRTLLERSHVSTPDRLELRSGAEGVIDGVPAKRFDVRDASGNLQILVISDHMGFDGMSSMPTDPKVKMGALGMTNCVARIDGDKTIVVIADRSYDDLAAVLAKVVIK